jgi:hypothetical protein
VTPLPGMSVRLYQIFAEACGRWATPNWQFGIETGKPRAYKPMQIEWKPLKMVAHNTTTGRGDR